MHLITLLKQEIKEPVRPLVIFLVVSGIANAMLIGIINAAAESTSNSELNHQLFLLFVIAFAVIILAKRYVLDKSTILVESVLYQLRYRIVDKIRHTELQTLETKGTSPLYARLTVDVLTISQTSSTIINATQAAIMILFTFLYIAFVSLWSFFLTITITAIAVVYTRRKIAGHMQLWQELSLKDAEFFDKLGNILGGFKEVKINRPKSEDVFETYEGVNRDLKKYRVKISNSYNFLLVLSQVALFFLMGTLLFLLPQFHAEHSVNVYKVTAAILFAAGPMEGIMTALEIFDQANIAARNIMELEEELEEDLTKNQLSLEAQNQPEAFEKLPFYSSVKLEDLCYSYPESEERDHQFSVGPVNLTLQKGELIFITGGNGSGKSTFLKLLTGLYFPESGKIILNPGEPEEHRIIITAENRQQYRNLFTAIFADFHLFERFYGMGEVDPRIVNILLQNMELPPEQVTYDNGSFSNLKLSSGQKKRLALAINIMEDKPIYVLDEVAADLDPNFRDKYYYEILRELKERHKTVVVVSHDRHYWTVPDRIFEMDGGAIRELTPEEVQSMLTVAPIMD